MVNAAIETALQVRLIYDSLFDINNYSLSYLIIPTG